MSRLTLVALAGLLACLPAACTPGVAQPSPSAHLPTETAYPERMPSLTPRCKNFLPGQPWACLADTSTPLPPGAPSPTAPPPPTATPAWQTNLYPRKGPPTCPTTDPSLPPQLSGFPLSDSYLDCFYPGPSILDLLNRGASIRTLISALQAAVPSFSLEHNILVQDLTADGVPEIAISLSDFLVFGCDTGQYSILVYVPVPDAANSCAAPILESTQDLNANGLPDLLVYTRFSPWDQWQIFEWNGSTFQSLIQANGPGGYQPGAAFEDTAQAQLADTDGNGTLELVIKGGIPAHGGNYASGYPWRETTQVYGWDGSRYTLRSFKYAPAQYRFQEVQDADRAALAGEVELARALYEDAISSDSLASWSPELRVAYDNELYRWPPTATLPPADTTERLSLAAYATYRIMLLDVLQGSTDDAARTHQALKARYATGTAKPYVDLASEFWREYSATTDITLACSSAVEFAKANEHAILTYLGSDYHGWQSHAYEPSDICPFTNEDSLQPSSAVGTPGA